ncbi:hypothetical protein ColLi_06681 [Colletotrichum liriopes]|uniref:Uncharacterized protein n=1 Tax=Colletotrichum liriopes TaxID=708192 RepID=A0AA37GPG0_9PEZI|nr:hypothetical protein ColLi_06681 [Colletotrichum liriopes]
MNYDQQHPAPGGYHHMALAPTAISLPRLSNTTRPLLNTTRIPRARCPSSLPWDIQHPRRCPQHKHAAQRDAPSTPPASCARRTPRPTRPADCPERRPGPDVKDG